MPAHRTALGMSRSPTYVSYRAMLRRCYDVKHERYIDYGARGVCVYFDWIGEGGFIRFLGHVGKRPKGKTLDRIDPRKGYEPGNVRWATVKMQARNRR
jgi:hypothetical protein